MNRGALLSPGFSEDERSIREIERGERNAIRQWSAARLPMQSTRDHQVNDENEVVLEIDRDSLADSFHPGDALSRRARDRGIDRPHDKRAADSNGFDCASGNSPVQGLDVRDDVRK